MVTDVVHETLGGGLTEIRMSEDVLSATMELRGFLFDAVYENPRATAEFNKASGVIGGIWERLHMKPEPYWAGSDGPDRAEKFWCKGHKP